MRINEINIDGFGVFNKLHITGFGTGLNVIYGPNEFGKTTVLEFVRRVLFGLSGRRGGVNTYLPVNGGNYGGSLSCTLDNGGTALISRYGSVRGGALKVHLEDRILESQDELDMLLNTSGAFFRNVYAVTIDEIQALESLNDEEVRNRIYGAGLELGRMSLGELKGRFQSASENIFKSGRGQNQELPQLAAQLEALRERIRACRQELPLYLEKSAGLLTAGQEAETIAGQVDKLRVELRNLERRRELFNDYVEVDKFRSKLDGLPESMSLPADTINALEKLKSKLEQTEAALADNRVVLSAARDNLGRVKFDQELLEQRGVIVTLSRQLEMLRSAETDAANMLARMEALEKRIAMDSEALGIGWTATEVRNFAVSVYQSGRASGIIEKLNGLDERIRGAQYKLELDRERKRTELLSDMEHGRKFQRWSGAAVMSLGLAGIVAGLFHSPVLAVFGGLALCLGIVGFLSSRKRKASGDNCHINSIYEDELVELSRERGFVVKDWEDLARQLKLPGLVSPENYQRITDSVFKIQEMMDALGVLRSEFERKQSVIDAARKDYHSHPIKS